MKKQLIVLSLLLLSSCTYAAKTATTVKIETSNSNINLVATSPEDDAIKALIEEQFNITLTDSQAKKSQPQKSLLKSDKSGLVMILEEQYKEWKNTPYRLGGLSRKGIDCSGLVMLIFREKMNVSMPRTTIEQVQKGQKVAKGSYKPGDLIFFKTGKNRRHVGIYYKDNQFLHASYSKGVMLSSLDNPYWQKHYWQTMRIL